MCIHACGVRATDRGNAKCRALDGRLVDSALCCFDQGNAVQGLLGVSNLAMGVMLSLPPDLHVSGIRGNTDILGLLVSGTVLYREMRFRGGSNFWMHRDQGLSVSF